MGREYALRDREPDVIARALYEQYLPKFAGGRAPEGVGGGDSRNGGTDLHYRCLPTE